MKVLVFGAGVIGSYLTHVLCRAGCEVTLLARGQWQKTLTAHGLELRHHLQHKNTLDHPLITDHIDPEVQWDAVFAVMPYHRMQDILEQLASANTDLLVMVGNNMRAASMQKKIQGLSKTAKEIFFAFQVTGGQRFPDHAVIERFGKSGLDIGGLHSLPSEAAQKRLKAMFQGSGYKLNWQPDMEAYLFCHPAVILPIAYLVYACGGDLRRSTKQQRKQMLNAPAEAYEVLKSLHIPILPTNSDRFFYPGTRRALMRLLYFIMAKSSVGDLIACGHCRNAVAELELLDRDFTALLHSGRAYPMPIWNMLKEQMPSWEEIDQTYSCSRSIP